MPTIHARARAARARSAARRCRGSQIAASSSKWTGTYALGVCGHGVLAFDHLLELCNSRGWRERERQRRASELAHDHHRVPCCRRHGQRNLESLRGEDAATSKLFCSDVMPYFGSI